MLAVRSRDQGLSATEIAAELEEAKHHIKVLAVFDTLEYLKEGQDLKTALHGQETFFPSSLLSLSKRRGCHTRKSPRL